MTDLPPHDGRAPLSRRAARAAATGSESSAERPASARTPAAGTLDALFTGEVDTHDIGRVPTRHDRDRRKSRIAKWVVLIVILAIVGGIGAGAAWVWSTYETQIRSVMGWEEPKDFQPGEATGEVLVTIVTGDNGSTISQTLFDQGVTKTASAFYDYLIASVQDPPFQPGVYALQERMTSEAALALLLDPASKRQEAAQLREGLTVEQSLPILAEGTGVPVEDFQAAVADPSAYGVSAASLEGWLFPATYQFDPGTSAAQIIQTLVNRTVESLDRAGVPADQRERILTIASIIEREARLDEDFYKVSRVIENRLADGMLLQMDSTAQYGAGELDGGSVSTSEGAQFQDNDWNTYVREGLPIGPIANPGDNAIDAAMKPADGPWLYFVTWNMDTGETIFSETFEQHEAGIAQWHAWCDANDNRGC
ncbi:endolytic transglycosylase MltG [Microbacterium radiodurans]|uniref:Endolytic murein transglycosylase n=1 Tax=Microbacterium radiodurans TaxID=661398 RepID=A0A5J5IQU1_9MICO|nr:endolytic transglycosylase MltG [Microbacterium radiodurans]KAA9087006.1 endolytic transglycosylase MltG [Microbacterium radiodurans]